MENLKRKKKKTLITKSLILSALVLIVALFCVVIYQSVSLIKLSNEIEGNKNTYQSEAVEESE